LLNINKHEIKDKEKRRIHPNGLIEKSRAFFRWMIPRVKNETNPILNEGITRLSKKIFASRKEKEKILLLLNKRG